MREASRLRRTTDVQRVRREGASHGDRMYLVTAARSPARSSRLALNVSTRLGSAVRRNRARRRARAAFGRLLGWLVPPSDLLVTIRSGAIDAPFADLARSAGDLLAEHGLLERPP